MSFFNTVMSVKKATLTNGCKRYYEYLAKNLLKASQINNWRVLSGEYKNYNFIIAKDKKIAEQLGISVQSIYNYKKTLKSLGLSENILTLKGYWNINLIYFNAFDIWVIAI